MSEYIAVKGITNFAGFGIVSIDHTDDLITYDFVGADNKPITRTTTQIVWQGDNPGFYFMGVFQNLNDFIRTNY